MKCEYKEGKEDDGGTKIIYCEQEATFYVSILGISPLKVCKKHKNMFNSKWISYKPDMKIEQIK